MFSVRFDKIFNLRDLNFLFGDWNSFAFYLSNVVILFAAGSNKKNVKNITKSLETSLYFFRFTILNAT